MMKMNTQHEKWFIQILKRATSPSKQTVPFLARNEPRRSQESLQYVLKFIEFKKVSSHRTTCRYNSRHILPWCKVIFKDITIT